MSGLRVGVDTTPLLGVRTGVGRYVAELLRALHEQAYDTLVATAFTWRGRDDLAGVVPPGVRVANRPAPARALHEVWARAEWPPVELLAGDVDVFHATNFVLPPLRRAGGVVTVHDLSYLRAPETVQPAVARYRALVPRSIRRARAVLVLTETVAAQVRDAYAPECPVVVTPLGVDDAWRHAAPPTPPERARLGLPAEYVLFVGTQQPRKGLATLLAAHRLVAGAPPLVLAGPAGWGDVDVTGCLSTGFLGDAELRSVVAGARALVVPSLDEGFGLPVIEALAAGTPVVASDLPVLREVGGDVTAYAAPGDPEALADALTRVLAAPGAADDRRRHAARFTWSRTAHLTTGVYRAAAGGPA